MNFISRLILLIFIFLSDIVLSQDNLIRLEGNTLDTRIGNILIKADQEGYSVNREGTTAVRTILAGVKKFVVSPENKKALLVNYPFRRAKENYNITYFLIDSESGTEIADSVTGYYDMPNPLFSVNDNGVVAYCDPAALWIEINNRGTKTKSFIFQGAGYEMERGIFIKCDDNRFYIAGNLNPVTLELKTDNVFTASVDIASGEVRSVMLPYTGISAFSSENGQFRVSGYTFTPDLKPNEIILDKELKRAD